MIIDKHEVVNRLGITNFEETTLHKALQRVPSIGMYGPWIAGGAVRRTIAGEKLDTDFDFFFRNEEQFKQFEDQLLNEYGGKLVTSNDKNHTYRILGKYVGEDKDIYLPEMKVQAIHFRYYDNMEDIINNFDFTLSQFAYDGNNFAIGPFSLWDVARKRLVPHKVSYGVSTLRRVLKYTDQGYTICAGGLSEILQQVAKDPSIINAETLYID